MVAGRLTLQTILLLSGVMTHAQTVDPAAGERLEIQTVLGFSNTFRLGRWTPLTVIVTNHDNNLTGEIEVEVTHGDELENTVFTTTYRRRLELTRNARKRFRFTVLLENFSRPLVIRVTQQGREISRHTVDLRRQFTEGRIIVVLSRDADLDYLNDSRGESLRVVYPHPELLPSKWQGYDGVSAMVVHGHSLEHLTTRQYEALTKWIAQGGRLVVSGGPDYSLLRTPRLASLLPAKPTGLLSLPNGAGVSEAFKIQLTANRPFSVNRVTNLTGRAIYQTGDVPLVIRSRDGPGGVSYFTFDISAYPFDRWPGMTRLWLNTFDLAPVERVGFADEQKTGGAIPDMVNGPDRGFPNHLTVLAFLVVYLGLLTTAYQRRGEAQQSSPVRRWLPWAAPLLFAPGAYFLFGPLLYPAGATAITVTSIEPFLRGSMARAVVDAGLYSNHHREVRWEFDGLAPVLLPMIRIHGDTRVATDWSIREGTVTSVIAREKQPYRLHQISGEDIITYDLHATATETDTGLSLDVRNNTGRTLEVAGLLFENDVYAVPDIPVDTGAQPAVSLNRILFSLDHPDWPKSLNRLGNLPRHTRHAAAFAIEAKIEAYTKDQSLTKDQALIIGVSTNPVLKSRGERLVAHHNVELVLVRVPVIRSRQNSRTHGRIRDDPG